MSKGIWLFGPSGSGKTYLSKKLLKRKKNSFLIDGDEVRKLISFDLGYNVSDRIKQNKRVIGLAKIVIKNGFYPIISSVYLDPKIFREAKINSIRVVNIVAPSLKINIKTSGKRNVVGKSISQPNIDCEIFVNSFNKNIELK